MQVVDWFLFASTFATLFVIMDPAGNAPVFISLTKWQQPRQRAQSAMQATVTSLVIISCFAIFGRYILQFLHISVPSLELSGGVLLFLVAMELLTSHDSHSPETSDPQVNVALVPLGTPLMAGPGAIVATMIAVEQAGTRVAGWVGVALAVLLIHFVQWLFLRFASAMQRFLGEGGTILLTKIAGLLLAAIATEMAASAIFHFISGYTSGTMFVS